MCGLGYFSDLFKHYNILMLQSKWSNNSKFGSHHLQHVHYKIVQLKILYFTYILAYDTSKALVFLNPKKLGTLGSQSLVRITIKA